MELPLIIAFILALVPAGIIAYVTLNMVRKFLEENVRKEAMQIKQEASKTTLPLRLQAYERLIILLERIRINSLVMRIHKSGMDAQYFQAELMKTIRAEFEHNVSQQLYVSDNAWNLVMFAKEEIVQMLNIANRASYEGQSATEFSKILFELNAKIEHSPIDEAIKFLKKEMRKFY